jgi:hypothetical protein
MRTTGLWTLGGLARAAGHLAQVAVVALGLGPGSASTPPERVDVMSRIERIRARLREEATPAASRGDTTDSRIAQWGNWGNWANWNNWSNWANWGNWRNGA